MPKFPQGEAGLRNEIHCVVEKVYGFLVYSYSYHKLGDLSTTLEMTVLSQLFLTRKDDLSRRFFATL